MMSNKKNLLLDAWTPELCLEIAVMEQPSDHRVGDLDVCGTLIEFLS